MKTPTFSTRHFTIVDGLSRAVQYLDYTVSFGAEKGYVNYAGDRDDEGYKRYIGQLVFANGAVTEYKQQAMNAECLRLNLDPKTISEDAKTIINNAIDMVVDDMIRSLFFIHEETIDDLIRWRINLNDEQLNETPDTDKINRCKMEMEELRDTIIGDHCRLNNVDITDEIKFSVNKEIDRLISEVQYINNIDYPNNGKCEVCENPDYIDV